MTNSYANNVKSAIAVNPTFKAICEFNINNYQQGWYERNKCKISNGIGILETSEEGITYMASYSDMHVIKLNLAFTSLFNKEDFNNKTAEIIDWGSGQALASCVLIDFIRANDINLDLVDFTLIEPSSMALQRGIEHIEALYQNKSKPQILLKNENADIQLSFGKTKSSKNIKIHLFSNLLDIDRLDLNKIYQNVTSNFDGLNYFVCVSPQNSGSGNLLKFYKLFEKPNLINSICGKVISAIFRPTSMKFINHPVTNIQYIFKTNL